MSANLKLAYDYAMHMAGLPYKWGGANAISGFDCSGFVQEILSSIGFDPPGDQNAQGLFNYFMSNGGAEVDKDNYGLGCIGFYGKGPTEVTHIVFMMDVYGNCIGADGGGSKTIDARSADAANAFIKIRPYGYRKDQVAVIKPAY